MEPWKDYIGNDSGVLVLMRPETANGAILTDDYLGTIGLLSGMALPNMKKQLAESFGIFTNSTEKKAFFYGKIKSTTFRLDVAEYFFVNKIYYNPSTDQASVLQLLQENDFNTFLTDVNTVELTAGNGADFLNYLL